MSWAENLKLALGSLRANKMRSFLTMLGIIIGISAVIAILTLGDSLTAFVSNEMSQAGANVIALSVQERTAEQESIMGQMVSSYTITEEKDRPTTSDLLSEEKLDRMTDHFGERIKSIGLFYGGPAGKVKKGRDEANVNIYGVNDGFIDVQGYEVLAGRWIQRNDVKAAKRVVAISETVVERLFDGSDDKAVGSEIKLYIGSKIQTYTVIGVYKAKSQMQNMMMSSRDIPTEFYIPYSVIALDYNYDPGFSQAYVMGRAEENVAQLTQDIDDYFSAEYRKNNKWVIQVQNFESMIETMTTMLSTVSMAISVIAGISLLVGGVGVMNIMLVSVTERTKEIGTRMAIGARSSYIRWQFITESVILCGIGGIFGVILGEIMGLIGSSVVGFPATASIPAIVGSVAFSMAIGVFFGYYPANKAAKLDPIEALRYE